MNVPKTTRRRRLDAVLFVLAVLGSGARPGVAQGAPDDVDALLSRAIALHQDGDILGAIDAYQAILAGAPERADVRSNLGAAYVRLGRHEEAIEQYRQALAVKTGDPVIRFNLGLALFKTERFSEAAEELARVVGQQPENKNALLLLSECHLQLGNSAKVVELLAPWAETWQEDRVYAYLLGTALIQEDDLQGGQVWIDRVLSGGDSAETRLLMGAAHLRAGDPLSAEEELSRAVELNPNLPTVHSLLGQALQRMGEAEAADRAYRRELEANPNDFQANLQLGNLRRDEGRYDEALAYLTRASRLRGEDLSVLYALGSLYAVTGDNSRARETLEGLASQTPDFLPAHVLLAQVYYRLDLREEGDRESAIVRRLTAERQEKDAGARKDASADEDAPLGDVSRQEPSRE